MTNNPFNKVNLGKEGVGVTRIWGTAPNEELNTSLEGLNTQIPEAYQAPIQQVPQQVSQPVPQQGVQIPEAYQAPIQQVPQQVSQPVPQQGVQIPEAYQAPIQQVPQQVSQPVPQQGVPNFSSPKNLSHELATPKFRTSTGLAVFSFNSPTNKTYAQIKDYIGCTVAMQGMGSDIAVVKGVDTNCETCRWIVISDPEGRRNGEAAPYSKVLNQAVIRSLQELRRFAGMNGVQGFPTGIFTIMSNGQNQIYLQEVQTTPDLINLVNSLLTHNGWNF